MGGPTRIARCLRGDVRGISAVEFALILPVMLLLLLGGYEYSRMLAVWRKLSITTRALTDLTTQNTSLTASALTTIMNASAQIFAPFSTAGMGIVVSEVGIDGTGNATVTWSQASNATPLAQGSKVTLPSGVGQANTSLIWSQVSYAYVPTFTFALPTTLPMSDQLFMSPRASANIPLSGS